MYPSGISIDTVFFLANPIAGKVNFQWLAFRIALKSFVVPCLISCTQTSSTTTADEDSQHILNSQTSPTERHEEEGVNSQQYGRSAQEYQIAMALELWRQKQEEHFLSQVPIHISHF